MTFDFEKKFLGTESKDQFITLKEWIQDKCPDGKDMLLQMDIEGAEYSVILDASEEDLTRFRILVIEFHRLHEIFDPMGLRYIKETFSKLLKYFEVVHIHPNNVKPLVVQNGISVPPVMEFTFLRKDRIREKTFTDSFPHRLDEANRPSKKDINLPECWYV